MKYAPWRTLLASSSLLDLSPEGSNEQWTEQVQPISRLVISMNSTVLRYSLMDPYSVLQFLRRPLGFVLKGVVSPAFTGVQELVDF